MNLESPKVSVQKSALELYDLLSEVKNFEQLMPENIAKFEVIGADASSVAQPINKMVTTSRLLCVILAQEPC